MGFHHYQSKGLFRGMPMFAALMLVLVVFFCPVASGETPVGELYQDEKGEWKIKYLNTVPQREKQPSFSNEQTWDIDDQTTEVELYQDEKGEWKVRYVTLGEQAPEPDLSEAVTVVGQKYIIPNEDVLAAEVIFGDGPTEESEVEEEGAKSEMVDDDYDDRFKEKTSVFKSGSDLIKDVKPTPKAAISGKAFENYSPTLYANDDDSSNRDPNHQWELGFDYSFYEFRQQEYIDNLGNTAGKVNEGNLAGIHFGYEHIMSDHGPYRSLVELINNIDDVSRYKFTLDYRTGQAEYSDVSGSPNEDFTQHILEAKVVAGYDFMLMGSTRLTPFMGLGYRYSNDPSGSVLDIPENGIRYIPDDSVYLSTFSELRQDYTLESHYFYLPIGFMTHNDILPDLSLGLNLEFDYVFLGIHRSSFSDLGVLYEETGGDFRSMKLRDTTNRFRGGIGLRGSARVTKKNKMFDWFVEPYIRYWYINQSDKEQFPLKLSDGQDVILFQRDQVTAYNHIEPENTTTEYGLQVGLVY